MNRNANQETETMKTTTTALTDTEIATLQQEAAQAGDDATVALCGRVLDRCRQPGDTARWTALVDALPEGEDAHDSESI